MYYTVIYTGFTFWNFTSDTVILYIYTNINILFPAHTLDGYQQSTKKTDKPSWFCYSA